MPNLRSYDFRCSGCAATWYDTIDVSEKDRKDFQCPGCGGATGHRTFSAPNITRASWPDGYKRKGWQALKEATKLEALALSNQGEERQQMKDEAKKIISTIKSAE